jgi:hypothetical protein
MPLNFTDIIHVVVKIIFILMMEHFCVVCVIECVQAMFLKPKLLKLAFMVIIIKALPYGTQCFLVPFLNSLALVLALKLIKIYFSLIYGFYLSTLLKFIIINRGAENPPS